MNIKARIAPVTIALLAILGLQRAIGSPTGTVVAWGNNSAGQSTVYASLTNITAIAARGAHSIALKSDGTVLGWGSNAENMSTVPSGLSGVTGIAAGDTSSFAVKADGTVVGWGKIAGGAIVPEGLAGVRSVSAGFVHAVALKSDGSITPWWVAGGQQLSIPADLGSVTEIAVGDSAGGFTVALRPDGTLIVWDASRKYPVPDGLGTIRSVAAGADHVLALRDDGTVVEWIAGTGSGVAWGSVPIGLKTVTAVAAGNNFSVALKSDGTVVAWGANQNGQTTIPTGLTNVIAIAAGDSHVLALKGDKPIVSIQPRVALATAQVVNGFLVAVSISDGGYGYTNAPEVRVIGGGGNGAQAQARLVDGSVAEIIVTKPGSGYTSQPSIEIDPPPIPPRRATGVAQMVNGFVVGVELTDSGYGYSEPPRVIVVGGGGTGAKARAIVANGAVTGVLITETGSGYTAIPRVVIASPPFAPQFSVEVSRVRLNLKVSLGGRYQIESSPDMASWSPAGEPFVAEEEVLAKEFDVTTTARFFRIQQLP